MRWRKLWLGISRHVAQWPSTLVRHGNLRQCREGEETLPPYSQRLNYVT